MKGASRVAIRTEEHKVSTSLTCTVQPSGCEGVMRADTGLCAMTTSVFVIHSYWAACFFFVCFFFPTNLQHPLPLRSVRTPGQRLSLSKSTHTGRCTKYRKILHLNINSACCCIKINK